MPSSSSVLILIISISIIGAIVLWFKANRHRQNEFDSREDISPERLYESDFSKTGIDKEVFLKAWEIVARAYKISPLKLRPLDEFDKDLAPLDSYNLGEGKLDLEKILRSDLQCKEQITLPRVKDFIIYYCEKKRDQVLSA